MISFRKIKPSSIGTPYRAEHEYYLCWLSPYGDVRQWLFSSTENMIEESFTNIVIDNDADFRGVPNRQEIAVKLSAMSLTNENFEYVASIFGSPRVNRVLNNELIPMSISRGRKMKDAVAKNFKIEFELIVQEPDLMNV